MIDSTENFYRVYLAITGMYALYVKPNSKEMISISLARCQEIFFFWKDRRGQSQVESMPMVFGIRCFGLVFLSCWLNKSMLCEKIWWGRYTGDSVEALNIGAVVVALTRQQTTNVQK